MAENKSELFNNIKNKTGKADLTGDVGIVNPESNSGFVVREDGNINVAVNEYTQFKMDRDSSAIIQTSLASITNSVIKEINATDIKVNNHKFNNQLIELTDFRNVNGNILGNIMMNGTVLVKT